MGRVAVANPAEFRTATADPADDPTPQVPSHLFTTSTVTGAVRELLERRAADLVAYQDDHTAARLINLTQRAWDQEREITERTDLSEAITRNFFKLIAYKDEYEVARMLTDPVFLASVRSQVPGGENLTFKLHPPILKALGRKKKISMGPRTHVALRLLAKAKRLRGTPLDPFGYTEMRRLERRLITHYEATINDLLRSLTRDSYEWALAVASAPISFAATRKSRCVTLAPIWHVSTNLGSLPTRCRSRDGRRAACCWRSRGRVLEHDHNA